MSDNGPLSFQAKELRRRAEEKLLAAEAKKSTERLSPEEEHRLVHELQVHQIELEMQNEELHRIHAELEVSWSQYCDLYDLAPVGYLTLNEQGLILMANFAAATLLGMDRGSLIKQPLTRFILPEDQDLYYLHRKQLDATGAQQSVTLRLLCAAERPFSWALVQATPVQKGECRVALSDITERKLAEEAQQRLQEELARAQKMESIGRLAGGVAHDFNNMLCVILGNAELAMEQVEPTQPVHDKLVAIQKAAQRSANVTRRLLAFARKERVVPKVLNLNETVEGMLEMLRRLIGENIDLAWLPGPDLWPVKMDPAQVDQVLANLCLNARDAIAGVGKLTIETGNTVFDEALCAAFSGAPPGEYVLLAISDDGCGMDKETLEHIFEPFFTTKEFGLSAGMGLATVYGIVKQNYGFISAESELGMGTTVKIYLPRQEEQAVRVDTAIAAEIPKACGETVLLVEDELPVLKMTQKMLELRGYVTLTAATPGEAIRLAKEHVGKIHLLFTDVVMPGMDGLNLAAQIREIHPAIKCLFMSGYTADIIPHKSSQNEMVHFLQKPFSINELVIKVREALDSK